MSPQASLLGLSASADQIIERTIDVEFSCANRKMGYYADINNDCKIFHICNPTSQADGELAVMQYSFFCPNGTQFQQSTLTCVTYNNAIPCEDSVMYYNLNDEERKEIPEEVHQEKPTTPAPKPARRAPAPVALSPVAPKQETVTVIRMTKSTTPAPPPTELMTDSPLPHPVAEYVTPSNTVVRMG